MDKVQQWYRRNGGVKGIAFGVTYLSACVGVCVTCWAICKVTGWENNSRSAG